MENEEYKPGECNLGSSEINRRKIQSIAGLIITVMVIFGIEKFHYPWEWKILIVLPLFYTIIGFIQAREKFCVLFGINGVYSFGKVRRPVAVKEKENRIKDRNKALKLFFKSILIASIITFIYIYFFD